MKTMKKVNIFERENVGGILLILCFLAAVGGVALFQHVLSRQPSFLDHVQKVPYVIGGVLGALSLVKKFPLKTRRGFLIAAAAVLFANVFVSAYAVGVEQKWWDGPSVCTVSETLTIEEINAVLKGTVKPVVPCNMVKGTLFGLPYVTFAFFNTFVSLFTAVVLILLIRYKKTWQKKR